MAVFFAQRASPETEYVAPVQGQSGTVLFFMNTEYGLSNVHLATAGTLLEKHPDVEVHVASFARSASKMAGIASLARRRTKDAKEIHFHELPGPEYAEALSDRMGGFGRKSIRHLMHAPGFKGANEIFRAVQPAMSPWNGSEHVRLYEKATELIQTIDPAVVVLDIALRPAIDAARQNNRLYAYLVPNILADTFWAEQPQGGMFWKFARFVLPVSLPFFFLFSLSLSFFFTYTFHRPLFFFCITN